MAIKTTLYPKTKRVGRVNKQTVITEKLDGSNIGFFKHRGELWVAQRNNVMLMENLFGPDRSLAYKGLLGWLEENGEHLQSELQENACVFGEWIGMGKIKYPEHFYENRFFQFAKCNVVVDLEKDIQLSIKNLYYDRELFKWSYTAQIQPGYMRMVPHVANWTNPPSKDELDEVYKWYCDLVNRQVEGFIVNTGDTVTKYVRFKNGKATEHKS